MAVKTAQWVRWPTSTYPLGYELDRAWRDELRARGVICAQCKNVRVEGFDSIDRIVIQPRRPIPADLTSVLAGSHVLSRRVVDVIGADRLLRVGRFVDLVTPDGHTCATHVGFIGSGAGRAVRASALGPESVAVCKACNRLLYWPGWPPSRWQVLRQDWDDHADLRVLDDWLMCSDEIWERVLKPAGLPRFKGHKVALVDESTDGLPTDFDEMVAEIRRRGWVR